MTDSTRRTRRTRSGGRRRRVLPVAAVILAVVAFLWGADALARLGAESQVARVVQGATGAESPPQVVVRGAFFLPQVIRGAYREVDVVTVGLTSGPLRVERVESQLTDVRVPFHDVLVRDIRRIGIGRSVERVTLRYDDLNAYFSGTGRQISLAPADGGLVEVTGSVDVLNRHLTVRTDVLLSVADGDLRLTPQTIDTAGVTLGAAGRALLAQRLTLSVPLGTLPFGHDLTQVAAGPDALAITATGSAIVVQP